MSTRTEQWSVELLLRYICATLVTWIAAAGAQLVVRTDFAVVIAILTLLGAPVSLYLRLHGMRIAGFALSRPLWNTFTVILFFVSAGIWTLITMSDLFSLMMSGAASQSFWLRFGAEGSLGLLMQVFLLFAAFRSFALISDKDATLATVPSFSVLLLLIPVHKGIEVVLYFLIWTLSATTLFALDHRAEMHDGSDGRIPAPMPGQDVRLAARGLATVLGAALIAAFSLSALLTSRNSEDRSNTESAITNLAGRLAQFAMSSSDSTLSGGPERQIDFSSGPALPSRTLLWRVRVWKAESKDNDLSDRTVRPSYFRLFTLTRYNGSTWTQVPRGQKQVSITPFSNEDWPIQYRSFFNGGGGLPSLFPPNGVPNVARERSAPIVRRYGFARLPSGPRLAPRTSESGTPARPPVPQSVVDSSPPISQVPLPPVAPRRPRDEQRPEQAQGAFSNFYQGFAISKKWPLLNRTFGRPIVPLRMSIRSSTNNVGFVPLLPGTRALMLGQGPPDEVRVSGDGSVDTGFVAQDQRVSALSYVPEITEYGVASGPSPSKKVAARSEAVQLTAEDRADTLELPQLSERVQRFAQQALAKSPADESNYGRARRLAFAIQQGATYTLRPPTPPEGREATDFFLFDGSRRGYCTHFASALAVLCRSQKIPARIVSGFAAQEYTADGWAQLREANAHAWTEVWVDNWGWAPVDATPSADRGDNAPNIFAYWGDWFGFAFNQIEMWSRARIWLLGIAFAVFIVGLYAFRRKARIMAWWARRRGRYTSDEWTRREIMVSYDLAASRLAKVFRPRAPFETPHEWLSAANESALDTPRARLFPRQEFEQLTEQYLRALYAPQAPEDSSVSQARALARFIRRNGRQ